MNPNGDREPTHNGIAAMRAFVLSTCLPPIVWIGSTIFTNAEEFA